MTGASRRLVAGVGLALVCTAACADTVRPRVVWWGSFPDPTVVGGTVVETGLPVFDADGGYLLHVELTPGVDNTGVYQFREGQVRSVIRRTDAVVGGAVGQEYRGGFLWEQGRETIALKGWLTDPVELSLSTAMVETGSGVVRVATEGDPAPEISGTARLDEIDQPVVAGAGRIAFSAGWIDPAVGSQTRSGVFAWEGGQRRLVARYGGVAPGTGGLLFGNMSASMGTSGNPRVWATEDGAVFVWASAINGGAGIWMHDPYGLRVSAYSGNVARNLAGITLGGIEAPVVTEQRRVLFTAKLFGSGGSVTGLTDSAIVRGTVSPDTPYSHELDVIMREGDPAPGIPGSFLSVVSGSTANDFRMIASNRRGEVLVETTLTSQNGATQMGKALYVDDGEGLRLGLRGEVMSDRGLLINTYSIASGEVLGPRGQIAFRGLIWPGLIPGLFVAYEGRIRTVVQQGDWVELEPGIQRFVGSIPGDAWVTFDRQGNVYYSMDIGDLQRAVISVAARSCVADLSGSATVGNAEYGASDGVLSTEDFFYYVREFSLGNVFVADMSSNATPGDPRYGVPDGALNSDDFFYYIAMYAQGC